jgi:hypothetical protein
MRTIEAIAIVTEDGKITIQLPSDIEPGEHKIVLAIGGQPVKKRNTSTFGFSSNAYWFLARKSLLVARGYV